jgi:hypothetical protein
MLRLEWIWEERNRTRVLLASAAAGAAIACADWLTKPYVSLGLLYLFPIMLAAGLLPRWAVAPLGIAWAGLSALFSSLDIICKMRMQLATRPCTLGVFAGEAGVLSL